MNRPSGSRIQVDRGDFGVRVTLPSVIPPRLAPYALPAILLLMLLGPGLVFLMGSGFPVRMRLFFAAFMGVPALISTSVGISRLIREWVFERTEQELRVSRRGLFGVRQRHWPWGQIRALVARHSGMRQIEDRGRVPVYDLVLELDPEGSVRLIKKVENDRELSWIAWNLQNLHPGQAPEPRSSSPPGVAARTQPAASRAQVTSTADGIRIVLPPLGVARRAADGALIGSLVLPVFSLLAGAGLFVFRAHVGHLLDLFAGALIFFIVVGAVMVFFEVNHRKRRGEVEATRERVRITTRDLVGSDTTEWAWGDIVSFRCGESGTVVNDVPRMALLIKLKDGRTLRRFSGRDRAELDWVASVAWRARKGDAPAEKAEMSPAGGTCQVCATGMSAARVFCAKCRTPHHEECWLYNGQCSTFGCREIRFTKS